MTKGNGSTTRIYIVDTESKDLNKSSSVKNAIHENYKFPTFAFALMTAANASLNSQTFT